MAKGTARATGPQTPEQEFRFDPGELVLLPMHAATYKALADAALRDGLPFAEFLQTVFTRAIARGVRGT